MCLQYEVQVAKITKTPCGVGIAFSAGLDGKSKATHCIFIKALKLCQIYYVVFHAHSRTKLKLGPEFIYELWTKYQNMGVLDEVRVVFRAATGGKQGENGYFGWSEFSLQAWREIPTNLA